MKTTYRQNLIYELIELQGDEFDPIEVMYLTNRQIVNAIINAAWYYKDIVNNNL